MKKHILLLLVITSPLILFAQKYSNSEKALIATRIDTLLVKYMQKSALSEQPGLKKRNEKMFKDFKGLFTNDASIYDDMNAVFDQQAAIKKEFPYKLETKARADYFDGLVDDFENGFVINNRKLNISYDKFDEGLVKAALERQIEGTSYKGYKLVNNDTLLLTIAIQKDKSVKISKIEAIASHIRIINDDDLDGVVNEKDDCPKEFGKSALAGCPDKDDDGIADKSDACPDLPGPSSNDGCPASTFSYRYVFSASAGVQSSVNTVTLPNNFDYLNLQDINKDQSNSGTISNPKIKPAFAISANIGLYIGKNRQTRNKGISLGFSFINYGADYEIDGAKYVFKGTTNISGSGGVNYTRIVLPDYLKEHLNFRVIDVPLLFKFKGRFGKAWAYEFGAGASYLNILTVSSFESRISFEGIFNNTGTYSSTGVLTNPNDLNLTDQAIARTGGNPNTIYGELDGAGYDFGYQEHNSGTSSKIASRNGFAVNGGADLFYHVTAKVAIKLGLNGLITPFSLKNRKSGDYKMVNERKDAGGTAYQSIYNSGATSRFTSYGLNLGIIIGI